MTDIVRADGFLGALSAAESIIGCRAVLHGPGGCRFDSSYNSSNMVLRDYGVREGPFYFTRPRVPCTYLDEEDYINGADYKVTDLLDTVDDAEVCVVICSPGTLLIGDDLNGAAYRSRFKGTVVVPEDSHMSEPFHEGYDATVTEIVKAVCSRHEGERRGVNILGVPVYLDGWEDTVAELRGYLGAMGLDVVSCPGAGCTVDELRSSASAALNITVLREFAPHTAEAYSRLGVPTAVLPEPVGFDGTEAWIRAAAEAAGVDPAPALEILKRSSTRAKRVLMSGMTEGMKLKCATYSVDLDLYAVLPLARWLYTYLGMFPEEIVDKRWWSPEFRDGLRSFLDSIGSGDALVEGLTPKRCDVVFADGATALLMKANGTCSVPMDLWPPSIHTLMFVGRPFLGARGALRMLDEMFEKAERRTCPGQSRGRGRDIPGFSQRCSVINSGNLQALNRGRPACEIRQSHRGRGEEEIVDCGAMRADRVFITSPDGPSLTGRPSCGPRRRHETL